MLKRTCSILTLAFALVAAHGIMPAPASASEIIVDEEDGAGGTCRIWCLTHNVHELIPC
jgi:hypothetical protein